MPLKAGDFVAFVFLKKYLRFMSCKGRGTGGGDMSATARSRH